MGAYDRYDLLFKVDFVVSDASDLTAKKGLNLVQQLRERLESFVFEKKTLKVRIIDLDLHELYFERKSKVQTNGSFELVRFEIIDSDPSEHERVHRINNYIKQKLSRINLDWHFSHYKTKLKIVNVQYS